MWDAGLQMQKTPYVWLSWFFFFFLDPFPTPPAPQGLCGYNPPALSIRLCGLSVVFC